MKEYMIYTTNDTEPFIVKTDEDLITTFTRTLELGEETMFIAHEKELMSGKFKYRVMVNVNQIVSISTREKVE